MPYARNEDLPPAVRERYAPPCQTVFREVFNTTMDRTGDEGRAMATAHTAAGNCEEARKMDEATTVGLKIASAVDLSLSEDGEITVAFATLGDPNDQKTSDIDKDGDVSLVGSLPVGKEVPISAYAHASWPERGGRLPVGKGTIGEVRRGGKTLGVLSGRLFTDTTQGRDTYLTVKGLGDLQEWSFGYVAKGRRGIWAGLEANLNSEYNVHEVSPVLVGAGNGTRTLAIKAAEVGEAPAAEPMEDTYRRLLLAVDSFTKRVSEIQDLRSKEGRVLSAANRERLTALLTALQQTDDFRKEIERLLDETDPSRAEEGKALELAFLDASTRLAAILHA